MNNNRDEGVIKFRFTLKHGPAPEMIQVIALEKWRALFFKLGLIGEYPSEKIGYGNLSCRLNDKLNEKNFLITGSQTGHLAHLQAHHYTKVIDCDLKKGSVTAEGRIPPSSESLTHFSIYQQNPSIRCIFHVHHHELWKLMLAGPYDSVSEDVPYGTIEMAAAMAELLAGKTAGLFVMKGHEDGIVAFGSTVEETGKLILDIYRKLAFRQ